MVSHVEYTILRTVRSPILKENDSDRKEFPVAKYLKLKKTFLLLQEMYVRSDGPESETIIGRL